MRAEYYPASGRHLVQFVHEDCARFPQFIDNMAVVNDFLADVYRGAVKFQGNLDNIDCADNSGAESSGTDEDDLLAGLATAALRNRSDFRHRETAIIPATAIALLVPVWMRSA